MGTGYPQGAKVSVVTTCYNAGPLVVHSLNSLKQQSLAEFELVIVDDGSTDETIKIIEGVLGDFPSSTHVKIIRSVRVGRAKALNVGIANSVAPLITILDADDVLHPDYLKLVADYLEKNATIAVASAKPVVWSEQLPLWGGRKTEATWLPVSAAKFGLRNPLCHSGTTIRRDVIFSVGGYDETRDSQLDYDLWIRLVRHGHRIVQSSEPLVGKRIHRRQSFEGKRRIPYARSAFVLQRKAIDELGLPRWMVVMPYIKFAYNVTLGWLRWHLRIIAR